MLPIAEVVALGVDDVLVRETKGRAVVVARVVHPVPRAGRVEFAWMETGMDVARRVVSESVVGLVGSVILVVSAAKAMATIPKKTVERC